MFHPHRPQPKSRWFILFTMAGYFLACSFHAQAQVPENTKSPKTTKVSQQTVGQPDAPITQPTQVKKPVAPAEWSRGFHLNLELAVNAPTDIGGRLTVEFPGRLRLSTSFGVMPAAFVDGINAVMVGAGAYEQSVANVLKVSLQGALAWRLHLEWRPFAQRGFYFGGGYGLYVLNGKLGGASYAGVATQFNIPSSYLSMVSYNLSSVLHTLNAEIGWEWSFLRVMSFRLAAGFTGTIAASTQIQTQVDPKLPAQAQTLARNAGVTAAKTLDGIYKSYVFSPVISMAFGFRFF